MNALWTFVLCIIMGGTVPAIWDVSKAVRENTATCKVSK